MLNFDRSTVKHTLQNTQNDCHQWLSDSSRVHLIRFWPGSAPDPAEGAYSAPQTLSWFEGAILIRGKKGKGFREEEGREREGERRGWKERGVDGREEEGRKESRNTPSIKSCVCPWFPCCH